MTSETPDGFLQVDFAGLAAGDAEFGKIFNSRDGYVDFQDSKTVQQLTKSILKRHFKLTIDLPGDRLCPPVPVRQVYEYIKWIQSLIDTTNPDYLNNDDREIIGIDIGIGASCIYPLLGCASSPRWRFHGTEVDEKSFQYASNNVSLNGFSSRIKLHKIADPAGLILPLDNLDIQRADFTMCNPPFFTSKTDMQATHLSKKRSPSAVCSGADVEMITEGGDFGFVLRILEESRQLQDRIQWYTSMLGKLSSATQLVEKLKEYGITNYAVTSLQAGNVTKRWAVAWSFRDMRPRNDVARRNMLDKQLLPFPTEFKVPSEVSQNLAVVATINKLLSNLDLQWSWKEETKTGLCFAAQNVWSRSARRKRKHLDVTEAMAHDIIDDKQNVTDRPNVIDKQNIIDKENEPTLGVSISIGQDAVVIRWLKGCDSVLYESFCGMLKRSIDTSPQQT